MADPAADPVVDPGASPAVEELPAGYPREWEADAVLADGGTVHLRPVTPADGERFVDFHSRLSPESVYYRFFAPRPRLSDRDVALFTTVDYDRRGALVALVGGDLVGMALYDSPDGQEAEVAFTVADAMQGRGLGSLLLEHLAAAARDRGITRFVADVLPQNRKMINVFRDAGFEVTRSYQDDVVHLSFPIAVSETSTAVMQAREHRAEARSVLRLLTPTSVAVVGASRTPRTVGHEVLRNLLRSGFAGPVYPVHPTATHVASVRAWPSVSAVPGPVDLAVVAVPPAAVPDVVRDCATKGVRGLVVLSAGLGPQERVELVRSARAGGMRVIGPATLGIANPAPAVRLNATLAPELPALGRVGFFTQSGALGVAILDTAARRGLGMSAFVSAGDRADVSGNDLLQHWEDDVDTDVVLLYLESFGNPRKFARLARRVSRRKPIVAVKSGRTAGTVPDEAVDALFRQAGVVRVDTLEELFDVAQVLAFQPLPAGHRLAIVANSDALGAVALDACAATGLTVVGAPVDLGPTAGAPEFAGALSAALGDPSVDAVLTAYLPPLATSGAEVAAVLAAAVAAAPGKPVVSTFLGYSGVPELLRSTDPAGRGSLPSFASPEAAVRALARAADYAAWRRRPSGTVPELPAGADPAAARALVAGALESAPEGRAGSQAETAALLAAYGVHLVPETPAGDLDAVLAAAGGHGYPVALKAADPGLRHRTDLGGVRLDLRDDVDLAAAYAAMAERGWTDVLVQPMAPPGVPTVIGVEEDPSFGSLVSFGVGGVATDLLGDRAWRALPLTDLDAADLVAAVRAAPLLSGYRGAAPVDVPALEQLLARVGRLADDLPEVRSLELNPVVVAATGCHVLHAELRLAPPPARPDLGPRRLR